MHLLHPRQHRTHGTVGAAASWVPVCASVFRLHRYVPDAPGPCCSLSTFTGEITDARRLGRVSGSPGAPPAVPASPSLSSLFSGSSPSHCPAWQRHGPSRGGCRKTCSQVESARLLFWALPPDGCCGLMRPAPPLKQAGRLGHPRSVPCRLTGINVSQRTLGTSQQREFCRVHRAKPSTCLGSSGCALSWVKTLERAFILPGLPFELIFYYLHFLTADVSDSCPHDGGGTEQEGSVPEGRGTNSPPACLLL